MHLYAIISKYCLSCQCIPGRANPKVLRPRFEGLRKVHFTFSSAFVGI